MNNGSIANKKVKNLISNIILNQIIEAIYSADYTTGEYVYTEVYENNNQYILQRILTIAITVLKSDTTEISNSDLYFNHLLDLSSLFKVDILDDGIIYYDTLDKYYQYNLSNLCFRINKMTKGVSLTKNADFLNDNYFYMFLNKLRWDVFRGSDNGVVINMKIYDENDLLSYIANYLYSHTGLDISNNKSDDTCIYYLFDEIKDGVYEEINPKASFLYQLSSTKISELITFETFDKIVKSGYIEYFLALIANGLMSELEFKLSKIINTNPVDLGLYINSVSIN